MIKIVKQIYNLSRYYSFTRYISSSSTYIPLHEFWIFMQKTLIHFTMNNIIISIIPFGNLVTTYMSHDARKSTHCYLALCSHVCLRSREVWVSRNCNTRLSRRAMNMYYQFEWMVVWLWTISSTSTTLLACNCNICFLQFKLWWLCWPHIQVGKYF